MSQRGGRRRSPFGRGALAVLAVVAYTGWLAVGRASSQAPAGTQRVTGANYRQAYRYSTEFLRQFVYSTSVTPNWIGKTDSFWYLYTTSKGKQWYKVNPRDAVKEPLFN